MATFIIPSVILLIGIFLYNSIVSKKNQIDNAFSSIDVMLKKRFDLIPNLVEIVKQYTEYEQTTLSKIVELRTKATSGNLSDAERNDVDQQLSGQIKSLMVNIENYPDLKANDSYVNLQRTWTESEEQIAAARRTFNASVTNYNDAIMTFPGSVFASIFSFQRLLFYQVLMRKEKALALKNYFNNAF